MTYLNKIDLDGIARLLDSGFPLIQCLTLLEDENNKKAFEYIKSQLQNGYAFYEFIDEIIPTHLKSSLTAFLKFLPLNDSIKITLRLDEFDRSTRYRLFKSLFVPLLMLIGCLLGIWLFTVLCFPALFSMMEDFDLSLMSFKIIGHCLNVSICIFLSSGCLIALIFLYFYQPKRIVIGYLILCKLKLVKPFRHFISTQFAVYFNECVKLGNSTQQTLIMLQKIDTKPLIVFLAYHVEQLLLQGSTMEEAMSHQYLEPTLKRFMQIAIHSSSLKEMLESYIVQSEEKGKLLCQRWTKRITLFAYSSIGVLIILIYQILLFPLSIIGQV